jgi:hypothetical protein
MKKIIILTLIFTLILSCSDSGTGPEQGDPTISFSPETISFSNGTQTEISLEVSDLITEIFAISLQLNYDAVILSFNEITGFSAGDFFGQNEISFIKVNEGKIHMSFSLTQGSQSLKGSGTLGTFTFSGITVGNCTLAIDESELVFYDESGNSFEISDLIITSTSISVE